MGGSAGCPLGGLLAGIGAFWAGGQPPGNFRPDSHIRETAVTGASLIGTSASMAIQARQSEPDANRAVMMLVGECPTPWGLLAAPVSAVVRDPNHTPYCVSSPEPMLARVLTEEWPHEDLLGRCRAI